MTAARRTWDASEYADKAKEREKKQTEEEELTAKDLRKKRRLERDPLHQGLIVSRANLQGTGGASCWPRPRVLLLCFIGNSGPASLARSARL